MPPTIKRLHELTPAQVLRLAAFIETAVHTDNTAWVCPPPLHPNSFGASYRSLLQAQSHLSALPSLVTDRWVALDNRRIVGVCCATRGFPDRTITLFVPDPKLSPADQLEVCDALALRGIDDVLADDWGKRDFTSCLPTTGPAAVYAKLCGMTIVHPGPHISEWRVGIEKMRNTILARRR